MNEIVVVHEMVYDRSGTAVNYRIIDCNAMLTTITGVSRQKVVGVLASHVYEVSKPPYLDVYARVVETMKPEHFEAYFEPLRKYFSISVFSPKKGQFVTVSTDVTQRKQMEDSLRKSEAQFRALAENSQDYIMRYDRQYRHVYANTAAITIAGKSREEFFGKTHRELGSPAHLCALWETAIERVFMTGKPTGEVFTWTGVNGEVVLDWRLYPEKDETDAVVSVLGVSRDITKDKKREDSLRALLKEKEVLLRELNHRVNNNLQLISSLFSLQSRYSKDPSVEAILTESKNRIRSIALVHEKLYLTKGYSQINFGEYITELAQNLFKSFVRSSDRIRLQVDVGDISLDIERAITCGLIINELVSNSLKYAFPGEASGVISISLKKIDDAKIELVIKDSGIGIPDTVDIHATKSLGMQLIHSLAEKQLEATIAMERVGGTVFTFVFKRSS
jgi:PAS domain S-box-containing protein